MSSATLRQLWAAFHCALDTWSATTRETSTLARHVRDAFAANPRSTHHDPNATPAELSGADNALVWGTLRTGWGICMVRLIVAALVFVVAAYASIWLLWIDGRPNHGTDRARRIRRLRAIVFSITGVALTAFIAAFLTYRPLT